MGEKKRARRRLWPWLVGGVLALAVAAGVVVGVFAIQAVAVRADLTDAKAQLADVVADVRAGGEVGSVDVRVDRISALTARARATVDTPLWSAFSHIPLVGQNVAAVRDVTRATDILVQDALPVGLQLLDTVKIDNLALQGGGIDLAPFAAAESSLPALDDAFSRAQQAVSGIDRSTLLPVVDQSIGQVLDAVTTGAPAISMLKQYLPTLLQMAGSDGPRRYLVIFQNLAETRATGGNPAATLVLTVDHGHMSMGDQGSSATFPETNDVPYLALPPETVGLYEDDTFAYNQNFTRTPDFPTTAALFRAAFQSIGAQDFDGVISVDPVVLAMILKVTGPVDLPDGSQITSDNAVQTVLSDIYARVGADGSLADAYFASVASGAFGKITAGGWSPLDMFDQLSQAAKDQRVYAWFSRDDEEAIARDVGIAGSLANPAPGLEVGVFLNDSAHSKLEYYLSSSIQVTCDVAARAVTTAVTMTNSISPDADISSYVQNARYARYGVAPTTMLLDVLGFAPPGGSVLASDPGSGDQPQWDRTGADTGRQAWSRTIDLAAGQTRTVTYVSSIPDGATGPVHVRYTPGVGATPVTVDASCDALPTAP